MNDKKYFIILLLLLLIFSYMRLVYINADVPHDMSFSGGVFSDEGVYSVNARNKVLYDRWWTDQWNDMYYNPSLTFIRYFVFKVFGVGIAPQRIISVIFSILSILLVYIILSDDYNKRTALIGTAFLGFNYLYVFYSRNGLLEIPTIAVSVIMIYCFQKGFKHSRFFLYAGAFTVFTYAFKNLFIYMLPVSLTAYIFGIFIMKSDIKKHIKPLLYLFSGYIFSYFLWYILHYLPLKPWITEYAGAYMKDLLPVTSLAHALYNFKTFPVTQYYGALTHPVQGIFVTMPVLYILCFIFVGVFAYMVFYDRKYIKPTDFLIMSYFFAVFIFILLLMAYRPTRYFIPFIVPLAIMGARTIDLLLKVKTIYFPAFNIKNLFFIGFMYIWGFIFHYLCILPFYYNITGKPIDGGGIHLKPSVISWSIIYFIIISILLFFGNIKKIKLNISPYITRSIAIVLVVLSLSFNIYYYIQWYKAPQFDSYSSAKEIAGLLPNNAVMAGLIAPVLALEAEYRPFFMFRDFMNYEDRPCIRHDVSHAILGVYNNEVGIFFETCPEREKKATLIRVFNILKKDFLLYSFVLPVLQDISIIDMQDDSMECIFTIYLPSNDFTEPIPIQGIIIKDGKSHEIGPFLTDELIPYEENDFVIKIPYGLKNYENAEIFFYLDIEDSSLNIDFMADRLLHLTGKNAYDSKYFNDTVRLGRAGIDPGGFLTYGPYLPVEEGMGIAIYYIGFDKAPDTDTDIAVIDVAADIGENIVANRDLRTADFENIEGNIKAIPLQFFIENDTRLEFRTFFFSTMDIYLHRIELEFRRGKFITISEE